MLQNCLGFKTLFECKMWLVTVKWLFIWLIHLSFNLVDKCSVLASSQAFRLCSKKCDRWDFWCWYEIIRSFLYLLTMRLLFYIYLHMDSVWHGLWTLWVVRDVSPQAHNSSWTIWPGKEACQQRSGSWEEWLHLWCSLCNLQEEIFSHALCVWVQVWGFTLV